MKLFFQVVAFVAVCWALVWAKKTYLDKPKPAEPTAAAPITTSSPGASSVISQQPQTATQQEENNAIANLLTKFTGGEKKPEDRARARMEAFMKTWQQGGTSLNDAEQAASCLFSRGQRFIQSADEIRAAYEGFTSFRKEKGLYTDITGYSIVDSKRAHDEVHGDYTKFYVVINSNMYAIGVPDKANPMFWTE